jgi:hypothetical protein
MELFKKQINRRMKKTTKTQEKVNKLKKKSELLAEQQLKLSNQLDKINLRLEDEILKDNIEYFKNAKGRYFKQIENESFYEEKYRFVFDFCETLMIIKGITLSKRKNEECNMLTYTDVDYKDWKDLREDFVEITKKEFDKKYNSYLSLFENNRIVSRDVIIEKST